MILRAKNLIDWCPKGEKKYFKEPKVHPKGKRENCKEFEPLKMSHNISASDFIHLLKIKWVELADYKELLDWRVISYLINDLCETWGSNHLMFIMTFVLIHLLRFKFIVMKTCGGF